MFFNVDMKVPSGTNNTSYATFQQVAGFISAGIDEGLKSSPVQLKIKYHKN
jgi:hypothetical protein